MVHDYNILISMLLAIAIVYKVKGWVSEVCYVFRYRCNERASEVSSLLVNSTVITRVVYYVHRQEYRLQP